MLRKTIMFTNIRRQDTIMRVADGARRRVRNHSIATRTPILSIMLRNANMVTLIRASAVGSVMRARVALVMRMVV